eukprot:CAMPEP_0197863646 /NCGR_PEP_ID=MMETSP1438-20131217/41276_1 /TAXON_ID=1461541 /ORGANISM="Pterosperma sp., Strain CCMP1384" /LENGTH=136 /DNA_ID=CAMNT_0043481625 /DNA_START=13 /DNA_END=423 /DNA_ORIENTATION=+
MAPRIHTPPSKFSTPRKPSSASPGGNSSPRTVMFGGVSTPTLHKMQPPLFGGSRGTKCTNQFGSPQSGKWARRPQSLAGSDDEDEPAEKVLAFDKKLFSKGVLEDMLRPNGVLRKELSSSAVIFQPKPNPRRRYID